MLVSGFDSKVKILDVKVEKHCGQHTKCHLTVLLHEDFSLSDCYKKVGSNVTVTLDKSQGGRPVFIGRIDSVSVRRSISGRAASITAISLSILSDERPSKRIFQNPKKTFDQVLSEKNLQMEVGLRLDKEIGALLCEEIIIQNNETNFHFICRLAQSLSTSVWIDDATDQPEIWVAEKRSNDSTPWRAEDIISYTVEKQSDQKCIFVTSHQYYGGVGCLVEIEDELGQYLVVGVTLCMEHDMDVFHYELVQKQENKKRQSHKNLNTGINLYLRAIVQDNKDTENLGRIKVAFCKEDIEEIDPGERVWLDYSSPYTGKESGIVFLPDVGNEVEVLFLEGKYFANASGRVKNTLLEECCNVENKYIGNNYKRRVLWKEKALEFLSGENKIIMDDEKIELRVKDTSLILSQDRVCVKVQDNIFSLDKNIELKGSQNLIISGKETEIKGSSSTCIKSDGEVTIKGSTINLC